MRDKPLDLGMLEDMKKLALLIADPRKIVGIWAIPRLRRDNTVEEWKLIGVVTEPCAMTDPGRL
jgi:hypothetical protein